MVDLIEPVLCLIKLFLRKLTGLSIFCQFPVKIIEQAVNFGKLSVESGSSLIVFRCLRKSSDRPA